MIKKLNILFNIHKWKSLKHSHICEFQLNIPSKKLIWIIIFLIKLTNHTKPKSKTTNGNYSARIDKWQYLRYVQTRRDDLPNYLIICFNNNHILSRPLGDNYYVSGHELGGWLMGRCVNADALADSKKRGKKIVFIIMIRVRVEKLESF